MDGIDTSALFAPETWRELGNACARMTFPEWDQLPPCTCKSGIDPEPTKKGNLRVCRKCKGWGRLAADGKALKSN